MPTRLLSLVVVACSGDAHYYASGLSNHSLSLLKYVCIHVPSQAIAMHDPVCASPMQGLVLHPSARACKEPNTTLFLWLTCFTLFCHILSYLDLKGARFCTPARHMVLSSCLYESLCCVSHTLGWQRSWALSFAAYQKCRRQILPVSLPCLFLESQQHQSDYPTPPFMLLFITNMGTIQRSGTSVHAYLLQSNIMVCEKAKVMVS